MKFLYHLISWEQNKRGHRQELLTCRVENWANGFLRPLAPVRVRWLSALDNAISSRPSVTHPISPHIWWMALAELLGGRSSALQWLARQLRGRDGRLATMTWWNVTPDRAKIATRQRSSRPQRQHLTPAWVLIILIGDWHVVPAWSVDTSSPLTQ